MLSQTRYRSFVALMLLCSVAVSALLLGYRDGEDASQIGREQQTSTDRSAPANSRQDVIAAFLRLGAAVEGIDDEQIASDGLMVTLKSAHLTQEGIIADEVFDVLKRTKNLLLQLKATPFSDAGLAALPELEGLVGLDVHGTRITDKGMPTLGRMTGLKLLKLEATRITNEGLPHLAGLTNLSMLYLSGTLITDDGLEHLRPLKTLTALNLSLTFITNTGVKHLRELPNLRSLGLDHTLVGDASLQHLVELKQLRQLYLRNTGVTNEFVEEFQKVLPDCNVML